jgi:CubicO group peptidase (beta-lactamase class C family)
MLIEKVSGQNYGRFLEQRTFRPAGMNASRLNSFAEIIPHRATGYVLLDEGIGNGIFVDPSQPFAAGAIVTSVADLAKWDAALYNDSILRQSTLQKMWKPAKFTTGGLSNYGLGWATLEWRGRRYVQHNGGIVGFSSHMRRFLDDGLTIIVLANLSGRGIVAEQIAEGIVPFYISPESSN